MKYFFLLFCLAKLAFADDGSVFRIRLVEDPGTLDWNYGETSGEIVNQLMLGLFRTDARGQPVAALASEWEFGKKSTFKVKLKKGVRWSDGKELCAADFVRSWRRLQEKKFASPYAHYAVPLLRSYSAKGCHELHIRTSRRAPELLALLAHWVFFPQREENLRKNGEAFHKGSGLLVNGPFRVKEWKPNQRLVLERNPHYSLEPKPSLANVEFVFIGEDNTALTLYEQGNLDWLRDFPPVLRLPKFKESGELQIFPTLISYYFGLNTGRSKLLQDLEIRKALSVALHREELPIILGSEISPASRWIPPEALGRHGAGSITNKAVLPAAKAKLLAAVAAGTMDLRLRVYSKPIHKQLAEWAQGQWEKFLGIRIPLDVMEEKVYWSQIASDTPPIFLSGVTAPYAHPLAFLQEFLSTSSANWLSWKSPQYDFAVKEQKFIRAEDILLEEGFVIPLYFRGTVTLLKRGWQGFQMNPLGVVYLDSVRR